MAVLLSTAAALLNMVVLPSTAAVEATATPTAVPVVTLGGRRLRLTDQQHMLTSHHNYFPRRSHYISIFLLSRIMEHRTNCFRKYPAQNNNHTPTSMNRLRLMNSLQHLRHQPLALITPFTYGIRHGRDLSSSEGKGFSTFATYIERDDDGYDTPNKRRIKDESACRDLNDMPLAFFLSMLVRGCGSTPLID
jgi:hypothetical protein